jgi:hypothetical protein
MRKTLVLLVVFLCSWPAAAHAQGKSSIQGFGGFTFGTSNLGGSTMAPSVGAAVSTALTPNIHIVGEGGRLSDIKPPLYELLDFTPFDLRMSAWYAQGGVRFITSPTSAVRPYTEATAGFARLNAGLSGFGDDVDSVLAAALGFTERTSPMFGLGGGVVIGAGPVAVDVGYRYKRIVAGGIAAALNAGDAYQVNEVRVGLGVRF